MKYIPRLKYVFCEGRTYQMNWHLPIFKYLNNIGIAPKILAGSKSILNYLDENNVFYNKINSLNTDYDVMISLATGFLSFNRYWLEKSMQAGKINIWAQLVSLPYTFKHPAFTSAQTTFLHAVSVADGRTINTVKSFNDNVRYLPVGDLTWDRFKSQEFKNQLAEVKKRFGEKLLLIGTSYEKLQEEFDYYRMVIKAAESKGFNIILQCHPSNVDKTADDLKKYLNPGIDRYLLFAAASHAIGCVMSTLLTECLYFGTKTGAKPLMADYDRSFNPCYDWITDNQQWYNKMLPLYGEQYLSILPFVNDGSSIDEFLESDNKAFSEKDIENIFGWPKVESYVENLFKMIEDTYGSGENSAIEAAAAKSKRDIGSIVDFSWDKSQDQQTFGELKALEDLIKAGVHFIQKGDAYSARKCLAKAEMFSGTEHYGWLQYLRSVNFMQLGDISKADKCIYRALMANPDERKYIDLSNQVSEKLKTTELVESSAESLF